MSEQYIDNIGFYRNQVVGCGVDSSGLGQGSVKDFGKHSDHLMVSVKWRQIALFVEKLLA